METKDEIRKIIQEYLEEKGLADLLSVLGKEHNLARKTHRPDIFATIDLSNFSKAAPAEGQVPIWQDEEKHWEPGDLPTLPTVLPVGTIFPWIGGYFTDGNNGGYTRVLGTDNTPAAVNALFNSSYFYVCDGAALNLAASPIWTGAGKYLPQITNARFLMGSTTAGDTGGSSSSAHTHVPGSLVADNEAAHTHAVDVAQFTSGAGSSHAHSMSGSLGNADANHNHSVSSSTQSIKYPATGTTLTVVTSVTSPSGNQSVTHSHGLGSLAAGNEASHTHEINPPNTASAAGSAHGHAISGSTGAASATENRPSYLSIFYLVRVA